MIRVIRHRQKRARSNVVNVPRFVQASMKFEGYDCETKQEVL